MTSTPSVMSPRLTRLQHALLAGDPGVLPTFWQEVEQQGTPLIEWLDSTQDQALVTFLWQGTDTTRNVQVISPLGEDLEHSLMERLPESTLWFKSYRVPNDLRFSYRLSPNDPLLDPEQAGKVESPTANWRVDPFCRFTARIPRFSQAPTSDPANEAVMASACALPAAPPQLLVDPRPDIPAGQITLHVIKSAVLQNERRVWVYTPPGYQSDGEPCQVVVTFDGRGYLQAIPLPTILDTLHAEGVISPTIALLIDCISLKLRQQELPCYPPFYAFLAHELLPWARQHYHITSDPAQSVVTGTSHGGLGAMYAALTYPESFGKVFSQSGTFEWKPDGAEEFGWVIQQYAQTPRLPIRIVLEAGVFEDRVLAEGSFSILAGNRKMRDVLRSQGYWLDYREFTGGHDYYCWRGSIATGLHTLLQHR